MRKSFCAVLAMLIVLPLGWSQSITVQGIVTLQSSGSKPLEGVQIGAFGASPVYSNSLGQFELRFVGKKVGDKVRLMVSKSGYELINVKEIEDFHIPSNPDDYTEIVMSLQGERDKQALKYYGLIVTNANNNYDKDVKDLKNQMASLKEDSDDRKALYQQIEELTQDRDRAIAKAEEMANQLAGIDLDRASGLQQEAMEWFNKGDIKQAIATLSDEALDANMREALEGQSKAKEQLAKAEEAVRQSISNFMTKARFCITDGDEECASNNYLKAVNADSTDFDNVFEFGDFLVQLQNFPKAALYFENAVQIGRADQNTEEITKATFRLVDAKNVNKDYKESETLLKNLKLSLAHSSGVEPAALDRYQAYADYKLGVTYSQWQNIDKAEKNLKSALAAYTELKQSGKEQDELDWANILLALGKVYLKRNVGRWTEADSVYQMLLPIYQRFADKYPQKYTEDLASIYYDLARDKDYLGQLDESVSFYEKAVMLYQDLNTTHFHYYDKNIAAIENGLAVIYYRQKDFNKADSVASESLEIYRQLVKNKSEAAYIDKVAAVLTVRGRAMNELSRYDDADQAYSESLKIYQDLSKKNPGVYDLNIGTIYGSLARLDVYRSKFAEAETAALKSLELYPAGTWINTFLAMAYLGQGKFDEAKEIYTTYKDKHYPFSQDPKHTWADEFLQDLNNVETAGVVLQDIDKARKLLEK